MAHTAEVLAAFQDGEVRLIFARHRETDDLVLLEDGTASAQRAFTKLSLLCPVRDCPSPNLTTVGRKGKRDGYRHLSGGGHAAEGIFHIQGCEMIAVWLRAKYPAPAYRVQKEERSNAAGERRADVMVTHVESNARIAFEIQYATLSPEKWQERHDSYVDQDTPDVWLFGHAGVHLTVDKYRQDHVHLTPTHEAVVESGLPLLWINPFTRQLGTAVSPGHGPGDATVDIPTTSGSGRLEVRPMDDFRLKATGLTSDMLEQLQVNSAADAAHRAETARQEVLRQERIARAKAAYKTSLGHRRTRAAAIAKTLEPAWHETEAYKALLEKYRGKWPEFLNVEITSGPGIPLPAGQWQSALFNEFWEGCPTGSQIYQGACITLLAVPGIPRSEVAPMVREWLTALAAAGYADVHRGWSLTGQGPQQTSKFIVTRWRSPQEMALRAAADAEAVVKAQAWRAEEQEKEDGRALVAQKQKDAYEADRNKRLEASARVGERSAVEQSSNPPCSVCKKPLYDGGLERGMHSVCVPGWRA